MAPEPSIYSDNLMAKPLLRSKNAMVVTALPLLIFMAKAREILTLAAVDNLKEYLIDQLNYFENQLRTLRYSNRSILAARYCLCASLDEAVLSTEWGGTSSWAEQSLLSALHKETWGGERFYIILEKMSEDVLGNFELLELLYIILSLGFEGKYYNDQVKYREIRTKLFGLLANNRTEVPKPFSFRPIARNRGKDRVRRSLSKLWAAIVLVIVILLVSAGIFEKKAALIAVPLVEQIKSVNALIAQPIEKSVEPRELFRSDDLDG